MSKTLSYNDRIKTAKRRERTVWISLDVDRLKRMRDLDRELRILEGKTDNDERLIGNPEAQRLAEEVERLCDEIRDGAEKFVLRAMPHEEWEAFRAAHPPRDDDREDLLLGVNRAAFSAVVVPLSIVEPEIDEEGWAATVAVLNKGQWYELFTGVLEVNESSVSVPFSPAASKIRSSGSESKRPND